MELEWVAYVDLFRTVTNDKKSSLTSKILRLQDGLRSWYADPKGEPWKFGDIFAQQHELKLPEKYTPLIAHLLLSFCVMNESNTVLFDAEKYASRASTSATIDAKCGSLIGTMLSDI